MNPIAGESGGKMPETTAIRSDGQQHEHGRRSRNCGSSSDHPGSTTDGQQSVRSLASDRKFSENENIVIQNLCNKRNERMQKECRAGYCYCFSTDSDDIRQTTAYVTKHKFKTKDSKCEAKRTALCTSQSCLEREEQQPEPSTSQGASPRKKSDNVRIDVITQNGKKMHECTKRQKILKGIEEVYDSDAPLVHITQEIRKDVVISEIRVNTRKMKSSKCSPPHKCQAAERIHKRLKKTSPRKVRHPGESHNLHAENEDEIIMSDSLSEKPKYVGRGGNLLKKRLGKNGVMKLASEHSSKANLPPKKPPRSFASSSEHSFRMSDERRDERRDERKDENQMNVTDLKERTINANMDSFSDKPLPQPELKDSIKTDYTKRTSSSIYPTFEGIINTPEKFLEDQRKMEKAGFQPMTPSCPSFNEVTPAVAGLHGPGNVSPPNIGFNLPTEEQLKERAGTISPQYLSYPSKDSASQYSSYADPNFTAKRTQEIMQNFFSNERTPYPILSNLTESKDPTVAVTEKPEGLRSPLPLGFIPANIQSSFSPPLPKSPPGGGDGGGGGGMVLNPQMKIGTLTSESISPDVLRMLACEPPPDATAFSTEQAHAQPQQVKCNVPVKLNIDTVDAKNNQESEHFKYFAENMPYKSTPVKEGIPLQESDSVVVKEPVTVIKKSKKKSKKKNEEVVEKKEEPIEKEEEVEKPEERMEEKDDSRSGLSRRSLYNENLLDSTLSDENVQILAQEKVKFNQKKKRRAPDIPRLAMEGQQGEGLSLHVPDDQVDPQKPYAEPSKIDDKPEEEATENAPTKTVPSLVRRLSNLFENGKSKGKKKSKGGKKKSDGKTDDNKDGTEMEAPVKVVENLPINILPDLSREFLYNEQLAASKLKGSYMRPKSMIYPRTQDADSTTYYSAVDDQSVHGTGGGSSRSQFSPLTIDTNQQNSQSVGGLRSLFSPTSSELNRQNQAHSSGYDSHQSLFSPGGKIAGDQRKNSSPIKDTSQGEATPTFRSQFSPIPKQFTPERALDEHEKIVQAETVVAKRDDQKAGPSDQNDDGAFDNATLPLRSHMSPTPVSKETSDQIDDATLPSRSHLSSAPGTSKDNTYEVPVEQESTEIGWYSPLSKNTQYSLSDHERPDSRSKALDLAPTLSDPALYSTFSSKPKQQDLHSPLSTIDYDATLPSRSHLSSVPGTSRDHASKVSVDQDSAEIGWLLPPKNAQGSLSDYERSDSRAKVLDLAPTLSDPAIYATFSSKPEEQDFHSQFSPTPSNHSIRDQFSTTPKDHEELSHSHLRSQLSPTSSDHSRQGHLSSKPKEYQDLSDFRSEISPTPSDHSRRDQFSPGPKDHEDLSHSHLRSQLSPTSSDHSRQGHLSPKPKEYHDLSDFRSEISPTPSDHSRRDQFSPKPKDHEDVSHSQLRSQLSPTSSDRGGQGHLSPKPKEYQDLSDFRSEISPTPSDHSRRSQFSPGPKDHEDLSHSHLRSQLSPTSSDHGRQGHLSPKPKEYHDLSDFRSEISPTPSDHSRRDQFSPKPKDHEDVSHSHLRSQLSPTSSDRGRQGHLSPKPKEYQDLSDFRSEMSPTPSDHSRRNQFSPRPKDHEDLSHSHLRSQLSPTSSGHGRQGYLSPKPKEYHDLSDFRSEISPTPSDHSRRSQFSPRPKDHEDLSHSHLRSQLPPTSSDHGRQGYLSPNPKEHHDLRSQLSPAPSDHSRRDQFSPRPKDHEDLSHSHLRSQLSPTSSDQGRQGHLSPRPKDLRSQISSSPSDHSRRDQFSPKLKDHEGMSHSHLRSQLSPTSDGHERHGALSPKPKDQHGFSYLRSQLSPTPKPKDHHDLSHLRSQISPTSGDHEKHKHHEDPSHSRSQFSPTPRSTAMISQTTVKDDGRNYPIHAVLPHSLHDNRSNSPGSSGGQLSPASREVMEHYPRVPIEQEHADYTRTHPFSPVTRDTSQFYQIVPGEKSPLYPHSELPPLAKAQSRTYPPLPNVAPEDRDVFHSIAGSDYFDNGSETASSAPFRPLPDLSREFLYNEQLTASRLKEYSQLPFRPDAASSGVYQDFTEGSLYMSAIDDHIFSSDEGGGRTPPSPHSRLLPIVTPKSRSFISTKPVNDHKDQPGTSQQHGQYHDQTSDSHKSLKAFPNEQISGTPKYKANIPREENLTRDLYLELPDVPDHELEPHTPPRQKKRSRRSAPQTKEKKLQKAPSPRPKTPPIVKEPDPQPQTIPIVVDRSYLQPTSDIDAELSRLRSDFAPNVPTINDNTTIAPLQHGWVVAKAQDFEEELHPQFSSYFVPIKNVEYQQQLPYNLGFVDPAAPKAAAYQTPITISPVLWASYKSAAEDSPARSTPYYDQPGSNNSPARSTPYFDEDENRPTAIGVSSDPKSATERTFSPESDPKSTTERAFSPESQDVKLPERIASPDPRGLKSQDRAHLSPVSSDSDGILSAVRGMYPDSDGKQPQGRFLSSDSDGGRTPGRVLSPTLPPLPSQPPLKMRRAPLPPVRKSESDDQQPKLVVQFPDLPESENVKSKDVEDKKAKLSRSQSFRKKTVDSTKKLWKNSKNKFFNLSRKKDEKSLTDGELKNMQDEANIPEADLSRMHGKRYSFSSDSLPTSARKMQNRRSEVPVLTQFHLGEDDFGTPPPLPPGKPPRLPPDDFDFNRVVDSPKPDKGFVRSPFKFFKSLNPNQNNVQPTPTTPNEPESYKSFGGGLNDDMSLVMKNILGSIRDKLETSGETTTPECENPNDCPHKNISARVDVHKEPLYAEIEELQPKPSNLEIAKNLSAPTLTIVPHIMVNRDPKAIYAKVCKKDKTHLYKSQSLNNISDKNLVPREDRKLSKAALSSGSDIFLENLFRMNNNRSTPISPSSPSSSSHHDHSGYPTTDKWPPFDIDYNMDVQCTKLPPNDDDSNNDRGYPSNASNPSNPSDSRKHTTSGSSNSGNLGYETVDSHPVDSLASSQQQFTSDNASFNTAKDYYSSTSKSTSSTERYSGFKNKLRKSFRKGKKRLSNAIDKTISKAENAFMDKQNRDGAGIDEQYDLEFLSEISSQDSVKEKLKQAVSFCRDAPEFENSTELVEAERLLLMSSLKEDAIKIESMQEGMEPSLDGKSGVVVIDSFEMPIRVDPTYDTFYSYFYIGVFSTGLQMKSTYSEEKQENSVIFRNCNLSFENLASDFEIKVDIYVLRLRKMSTMKVQRDRKSFLRSKKNSSSSVDSKEEIVSRFRIHGYFTLRAQNLTPYRLKENNDRFMSLDKFTLVANNSCYLPINLISKNTNLLDEARLTAQAEIVFNNFEIRGFLNVEDRGTNKNNWNRRWCQVDAFKLFLWNYPQDCNEKDPILQINLTKCITYPIGAVDRSICAKTRSFLIEVKMDENDNDSGNTRMYLFSTDNQSDFNCWVNRLNDVLDFVRTWKV